MRINILYHKEYRFVYQSMIGHYMFQHLITNIYLIKHPNSRYNVPNILQT